MSLGQRHERLYLRLCRDKVGSVGYQYIAGENPSASEI